MKIATVILVVAFALATLVIAVIKRRAAAGAEMVSIDTLHASAFGRMPDVGAATMRNVALARDALGRP